MEKTRTFEEGVEFKASIPEEYAEILTPEAVSFVAKLNREFGGRVEEILEKRKDFQERIDAGEMPDFLPETKDIRGGDWKVAPVPRSEEHLVMPETDLHPHPYGGDGLLVAAVQDLLGLRVSVLYGDHGTLLSLTSYRVRPRYSHPCHWSNCLLILFL